ncbi:MAG: nucleotide exchange factor GrpE [bacterium]|nr:nucleotide exchange factor GrpE [bacterium]
MEKNKNNPQNNNPPVNEPIDGSTGSPLKEIEEKLIKCEKEKEEYLNGWKRAKADSINQQKDELKRMEEIMKFANADIIKDLLLVLDSFELSLLATKDPEAKNSSTSSLREGIEIIYSQLEKILNKQGLEKIKALGEKFDPALHEAMLQEESDKESGTILEEMVKGWKLNGKVIRPTKVRIAK